MKLTSDKDHPDFHEVVHFIDKILLDGQELKHCVHIDLELGEAQCVSLPIKTKDNAVVTHVVRGKLEIVWRKPIESSNKIIGVGTIATLEHFKKDWEQREQLRKSL